MARLLQIAQLGHPPLRQWASEVTYPLSDGTQALLDDMFATTADCNGLGLAAPQVYASKRLFIAASKPNSRYPDALEMEPVAVINPKITWKSKQMISDWEGCLSIPGIRGLVPRHREISMVHSTRNGERVERHYSGFIARLFQHEYDHLEGVVFLDRVLSTKDIITENSWLKLYGSLTRFSRK